ncbi:MAG: hypothetical protein WDW38_005672 [Sanguina aurantia]
MDYHQGGAGATSGELPLTELELLIEHLAARSVAHTNKAQREELTYKDVASSVREWRGCHDFLNDVVPMKTTLVQIQAQGVIDAVALKQKEELQAQQQVLQQQQAQQLALHQAHQQQQQQAQMAQQMAHQMQQQRQMQIQRQMVQIQQLQQQQQQPQQFMNLQQQFQQMQQAQQQQHNMHPQHHHQQQQQPFPNNHQQQHNHPHNPQQQQQQQNPQMQQHQLQQTLMLHTQMLQAQQAQAMQAQQQFGIPPQQHQHNLNQQSSWPLPGPSLTAPPLHPSSSPAWPPSTTAALSGFAQQMLNSQQAARSTSGPTLPPAFMQPPFRQMSNPLLAGAGNYSHPDMSASAAAAAASFLAQNGGGFSAAAVAAAAALMPAGVNHLAALQGSGMMGMGNASEPMKQPQQPQQQEQQQMPVIPTLNLA